MSELSETSKRARILISRGFLETLLLSAIIPIWLGVAVVNHWITINELYVIFLIIYTVLLCLLFLVRYVKRTPMAGQVGFLMFAGVPIGTLTVYCIFAMFSSNAALLGDFLRSFFIILCLLLPGGLYYQFIGSRRQSVLNGFIVTLDRLGLFNYRKLFSSPAFISSLEEITTAQKWRAPFVPESEFSRARRVRSYFERFEAVYGPLPIGYISTITEATKPSVKAAEPSASDVDAIEDVPLSLRHTSPVILLLGLSLIGWITILPPFDSKEAPVLPYLISTPTAVGFAFLGAYFFTLQFLVWRFVRKDLNSNAYVSMSLRIILAVIGVFALIELLAAIGQAPSVKVMNTLAFCIGAFPMILWQFLSTVAARYSPMAFVLPNIERGIPLSELDGLSIWHETRLQEEDIENVLNLASADLIDLFLNTRLASNRIIDWMDQAILLGIMWGIEPKGGISIKEALYSRGIRSVTAIDAALNANAGDSLLKPEIELPDGAKQSLHSFLTTIREVADTNPNFALVQTWKGVASLSA